MGSIRRGMLKTTVFSQRIHKMRKEFDGKTQAVRGSLIAELEELHQWALERAKKARKEKHKQKWSRIAAYIAKCVNVVMRDYDSNKIVARLEELEKKVHELREKDRQAGKRT